MPLHRALPSVAVALLCGGLLLTQVTASAQVAFQGFENPADVTCWSGDGTITRVPSGGGVLGVMSFHGSFHAEITNQDDAFQAPGFGDSKFTEFCLPPSGFIGDFAQSISVYINANWPPAALGGTPSFWIDESPRDAAGLIADGAGPPASAFTAEHNFRLTATGTSVQVAADGQATPFVTLSTTGWYTFQMTWRKDPNPANPVLTDFNVYNSAGVLVGHTTLPAAMVGTAPPLPSSLLGGPGYLWFTVWQNGFARDVLAIDDARVDLLSALALTGLTPGAMQIAYASNLNIADSVINITNNGANGAPLNGPGFGTAEGNICVNVFAYSPDEQLVSCCSCLITPNGLVSLSVVNDLLSNTFTGIRPNSVVVKLLTSATGTTMAGGASFSGGSCTGSAALAGPGMPFPLAPGADAWATTIHVAATGFPSLTEIPFTPVTLSAGEVASVTNMCANILGNGSGFGVCKSCRPGGLGANRQ